MKSSPRLPEQIDVPVVDAGNAAMGAAPGRRETLRRLESDGLPGFESWCGVAVATLRPRSRPRETLSGARRARLRLLLEETEQ